MMPSVNFSSDSLFALNICLAIIMFGVSLEIKFVHFKELINQKKSVITGLVSQFILLPLLTLLLVSFLPISNGIALGMILVAACPGGNVSNFFSMLAKGNVALSVALTATSSLLAFIVTPLNFFFWASVAPGLSNQVNEFHIDFFSLLLNMVLILLLPLLAGMWFSHRFNSLSLKISKPVRIVSIVILFIFIVIAFTNNRTIFIENFSRVFWIVVLHNSTALFFSYIFSATLKNNEATNRTVAIETAIQNSGLGLILIFTFFGGNAEMALVAAWWGIWHLVSGFAFASWMRRKPIKDLNVA